LRSNEVDFMDSPQSSNDGSNNGKPAGADAQPQPATVVVRGEAVRDEKTASPPKDKDQSAHKKLSADKVRLQQRLPALEDDAEVGVPKAQVVTREDKADLAFTGTLLASAAPSIAPDATWQEYRIYETDAGKYVFSRVTRHVEEGEDDDHEAEVFEPTPTSMSAQLMRSAHDLLHTHPKTWTDAAVDFFGYDPLAKALYRKLGSQFEEHIA
jgi:hypothetical protein